MDTLMMPEAKGKPKQMELFIWTLLKRSTSTNRKLFNNAYRERYTNADVIMLSDIAERDQPPHFLLSVIWRSWNTSAGDSRMPFLLSLVDMKPDVKRSTSTNRIFNATKMI